MAKITASEERTLAVSSPVSAVYRFFINPQLLKEVTADVESMEQLEPNKAHWVLTEKVEKGIRYQANYTVEYTGNGSDQVSWRTVEGNLETEGRVRLVPRGESITEIHFSEKLTPDLPITPILAKVFKPIVAREVKKDIGKFLDRVEQRLGRLTSS